MKPFREIDTKDPSAVAREVSEVYSTIYPDGDPEFVDRAFGWLHMWFTGQYKDYQAIDASYHDYEHTLQGTLCLVRILLRRYESGAKPEIPQRLFEMTVLAIMMHDTGYLKHAEDTEGTGAKYTLVHVHRSAGFAEQFLLEHGFPIEEVRSIKNMIYCTGVDNKLEDIPFANEIERMMGAAVATADLLGQMAASDYVEKLAALFAEFTEAAAFHPDRPGYIHRFKDLDHMFEGTPGFWECYVIPKINSHCLGLYKYLNSPYPDGNNEYLDRIEANIDKVRKINEQKK